MCVLAPPPAHRVEQKATFSQNQPNDLKLMALTVVPTNTPAMLEHGFKLCIFVGVACRYLLQDHSEPPQRNELSPKVHRVRWSLEGKCLTDLLETLKLHFLYLSITGHLTHVYTAYHDCFFYTRHLSVRCILQCH